MRNAPAAHSMPSDPNEVTLLELLGLVSCLSGLGLPEFYSLLSKSTTQVCGGPNPAAIGIFLIPVNC